MATVNTEGWDQLWRASKKKGIACMAISAAAFAASVYAWHSTQSFLVNAIPAEGTVVEIDTFTRPNQRDTQYEARIQFFTESGDSIEIQATNNVPGYAVGDNVKILYEIDRPYLAIPDEYFAKWGSSLISGALGVLLLLAGVSFYWRASSRTASLAPLP